MTRYPIYIDLTDEAYEQKLSDFLTRRYPFFDLTSVSLSHMASEEVLYPRGIYLHDRELSEEEEFTSRKLFGRCVRISEEEGIDPYQAADQIARKLLSQAEEFLDTQSPAESVKGRAIAVYSASGGRGVSTLALCLAKLLSKEHKTLLLPFSRPNAYERYLKVEKGRSLGELLYSFLAEPEELFRIRVREGAVRQRDHLYYLAPTDYVDDLTVLLEKEMASFMEILTSEYEFLVLDLPPRLSFLEEGLLLQSPFVAEILDPSEDGVEKRKAVGLTKPEDPNRKWYLFRWDIPGKERKRSLFYEEKMEEVRVLPPPEFQETQEGLVFREGCGYVAAVMSLAAEILGENEEY